MAKKEKEQSVSVDPIQLVEKQIIKNLGENIFVSADEVLRKAGKIISWSPSIDLMLSGGVRQGSTISVSGKPKTGKSSSLLALAVKAQQEGMFVCYFDIEARIKEKHLKGTKGLDLSPSKFRIIQSNREKILTSQDNLQQAELILKTVPNCFMILDSISALVDSKELENGVGTETRGHGSKVISQFVNNVSNSIRVMDSVLCGIVHIIANTSGYGSPTMEKAANRWLYQTDVRLRIKSSVPWKVGGETGKEIGKKITWECLESDLGPPGISAEGYLRYNVGLDELYELIQFAIAVGLIEIKGSWYILSFLKNKPEEEVKVQGQEAIYEFLGQDLELQKKLKEEINKFSNNLIGLSNEG